MSIIRINKNKNYTVISNHHLKNKNLSLKAKGLLTLMLSLPDDWDYSVSGLVKICLESKTAIQNILRELESLGYLQRTRTQDSKGLFRYVYDIFEQPQQKKPQTENLVTDNPCTDNRQQLNTNKQSTKELNTNTISISKKESSGTEVENKERKISFNDIIEEYTQNEQLRSELKEHLKTRKAKKAPVTNRALILSLNKLDTLANTDEEKIIIVQNSIMNGWTGFFKLNNDHPQYLNNKKCKSFHQEPASYNIDEYESLSIFDD